MRTLIITTILLILIVLLGIFITGLVYQIEISTKVPGGINTLIEMNEKLQKSFGSFKI